MTFCERGLGLKPGASALLSNGRVRRKGGGSEQWKKGRGRVREGGGSEEGREGGEGGRGKGGIEEVSTYYTII